jgi:hypothetical protein
MVPETAKLKDIVQKVWVVVFLQNFDLDNFVVTSHKIILQDFLYFKLKESERVTKTENIKTDSTKILRPTLFSG